jgi:hypothetical protein
MSTKSVRKGFKILNYVQGIGYFSSNCQSPKEPFGLQYRIGVPAVPKPGCGPLCVFKTLEDAREGCWGFDMVVFECEYLPSIKRSVWYRTSDAIKSPDAIKGIVRSPLTTLPHGKALAESVTITKKVWGYG